MIPEWLAAMRRGDFATAWKISDAVLASRDLAEQDDPRMPYHLRWVWDGRPFRDRRVLVRCYHGLGDTIQFARYLTLLRPLVRSLTVEVQPALLPLLASVPGPDRLIPFDVSAPQPPSDCDMEIMELAHALRVRPEDAPHPPYLNVDPQEHLNGSIGISCQAGDWDADRAIPEGLVHRLIADRCAFTLQPYQTALPVRNPGGAPSDMLQTASLIAGLDRVITVDTVFAHLAGAMDRPTWLLIKHDADWRWMEHRADTPWYPSIRIFRQKVPGDWGAVIADVEHELKALC